MARPVDLWRSPAFAGADSAVTDSSVELLGATVPYPPADWADENWTRLQRFHLNYGEEVLAWARLGDGERAGHALDAWIAGNPPRQGDAWHPYSVSTRIGNWVAAISLAPQLATPPVARSLDLQVRYLARNIEWDVLGNHLIRNVRGLVLGSLATGNRAQADDALRLLRDELGEQVLADGGHFERSPVYHSLVLRDLLEIEAAAEASWLRPPIERMRTFAAALQRPDGRPATFNDAPLELAPALDVAQSDSPTAVLPHSGYVVARAGRAWIAFDCGPPGPPHLPAHSHADALSVQVWADGRPLVVDPGTFTYDAGPDRNWFRGTRSHSTVAVDGKDQFLLWGAFRSGPLPGVELLESSDQSARACVVHATTAVRHTRTIHWSADKLVIADLVEGAGTHLVESTLPFAAEVQAEGSGGELVEEAGWVSERLYERSPIRVLRLRAEQRLPAEMRWEIPLGAGA